MFFRRVTFLLDGAELCSFTGMTPPEGRTVVIENALLGRADRYRVDKVVEIYGSSDAHDSVMTQVLGGGVFAVTCDKAEVHLVPDRVT